MSCQNVKSRESLSVLVLCSHACGFRQTLQSQYSTEAGPELVWIWLRHLLCGTAGSPCCSWVGREAVFIFVGLPVSCSILGVASLSLSIRSMWTGMDQRKWSSVTPPTHHTWCLQAQTARAYLCIIKMLVVWGQTASTIKIKLVTLSRNTFSGCIEETYIWWSADTRIFSKNFKLKTSF